MKRYRVWLVNIGFYAQENYEHLNQAVAATQAKGFEARIDLYDYDTKTATPIRAYSPLTGWSYYQ